MGFGMIAAGFVILFNPVFNIIDFLPDFIGALLIYAGLTKTAVLNEDVSSARKKFLYLALIDIAKMFCIGFLSKSDGTRYLMFATIFGVLECICFIPAICELFIGIEHMGMTYGSASINRIYQPKWKRRTTHECSDSAKKTAILFYITRNFFALAPELTELQGYEYSGVVDPRAVNLPSLKPTLYFFSALIVLAFGVLYLKKNVGFWLSVKHDAPFINDLQSSYSSFTDRNRGYLSAVKMSGILTAVSIASFSVFTIAPNNLLIFPSVLCAFIVGITAIIAAGNIKKALPTVIMSALSAILSAVTLILSAGFYEKFDLNDIFQTLFPDATASYFKVSAMFLVERLCLAVAFLMLLLLIRKNSLDFISSSVKVRAASNSNKDDLEAELAGGIKKRFSLCTVFSFITIVYSAVLPYIYFGTGTVFEQNRDVLMSPNGVLDFGVLITSSFSMYIGIFTVLIVTTFALTVTLRRYMKLELINPICDWGREV